MKKIILGVAFGLLIFSGATNAQTLGDWFKQKSDEITKNILPQNDHTPSVTVNPLKSEVAPPVGAPQSFADLAEILLPSVVNISSTQKIPEQQQGAGGQGFLPPGLEGSPFEQLFRDFFERHGLQPPMQGAPQGEEQGQGEFGGEEFGADPFGEGSPFGGGMPPASALGSGFIIDAEKGLVVTNNHVVKDADEVRVILADDTSLEAKILGKDEKTDLALLQVTIPENEKQKLKAVKFGDSDKMRVGDWVMAIGNPFGLGGTVTSGIISARQRNINAGPYDDFLQTDAAINRGNSGGPMFNLKGEVIGINTAIFSPTGGSVGIGFAIPSNLAKNVIGQLAEFGKTRRGWLGIRIQSVTPEIAETLGLPDAHGAMVASITKGGPAEKADLKQGDVIVEFNGQKLSATRQLPRLVAETKIGSTATLKIFRNGKMMETKIEVGELEKAEEQGKLTLGNAAPQDEKADANDKANADLKDLGVILGDLNPQRAEQFDIPANAKGVLVLRINPSGEAAQRGLSEGDVIVEVNGAPVLTARSVEAAILEAVKAGKKSVLLLVDFQGRGDVRFVALRLKK